MTSTRLSIRSTCTFAFLVLVGRVASAQDVAPVPIAGPEAKSEAASAKQPPASKELPKITPGEKITLAEALERADNRNLTLAAAREEVAKANAGLKQAWGLVLPVVQGQMSYTRMDHPDTLDMSESLGPLLDGMGIALPPGAVGDPLLLNPQDTLKGTVQAQLPLLVPENWFKIESAKLGTKYAELSVEDGRRKLLLGVAQAFHYTLLSEELIELYRVQVTAAREQLSVAKARFKAGSGMRIDVIRAETDVERTYQDLLAAHLAFDNARDSLGELIGSGGLPMPEAKTELQAPPGTQESWAFRAASERVDVAAARAKLELTEDQKSAAWMQFLPNLSAAWQGTYQFTDMPDMGSSDRSRWAAVLTLTVPIYNHFRYGDLDQKRAAHRQAQIELQATLRDASLRVRKSRRDYKTALASVETAKKQNGLAEEGLKIAEASYRSGAATSLDVTQARRDFTATAVNLATQKLKAQIALLNLLDAVGSDLSPSILD